MGKFIACLILALSIMAVLAGIIISVSDLDNKTYYYASGKLAMNSEQWETFKQELYLQPNASINYIHYLDSGELKIVEFNNLEVTSNFSYGDIVKDTSKRGSSWQFGEWLLITFGGLVAICCITYICNE